MEKTIALCHILNLIPIAEKSGLKFSRADHVESQKQQKIVESKSLKVKFFIRG